MSIAAYPGNIALSLLAQDLEYGLLLLREILTQAVFKPKEVEKVRAQMIAQLKNFWDEPRYFAGQLIKEQLYKNHPYSKSSLGTIDAINNITRNDLLETYRRYISPHGARLAIVGDLDGYDVQDVLEKTLGNWEGSCVEDIQFPELTEVASDSINYHINRDQVVLRFAGRSIDRKHPDYDKLLLFDQLFGGGVLGSMHSRLFKLREQSGLFYTIGGSLVAGADEQPGMILVQTIVSRDRLAEAEHEIKKTIQTAADAIELDEFQEAQRAIVNAQIDNFSSNYNIANSFLFLDRYKFPIDFFDKRAKELEKLTVADVATAAQKTLKNKILILRVGRIDGEKEIIT
jgi:zinc protease